nr:hypothetical protein [Tanacetum cinerariifolium]
IVHNSKDTLEIAKITRKKINDKMNDPECVTRKVKIAPHDYSKENLLAIFTPQKQLTPKQIFWSNDLLKSEALKERTKVSRPLKAFTVVATNSELNVARFSGMHVANTTVETRCLALKAELANLREKNNHDNQKELINHFSKLEVSHLNLQLKYQNLKDRIRNNPSTPAKHTPDFDSVFVIGKMQASLQGKDNDIRQLKKKLSQLQVTRSDTDRTLRVQTTDSQITKLTDHNYKELSDSIKITRAKHIEQKTNVPVPPSTGVTSYPKASGSQPKSNPKTNRISPAKGANKLPVEDLPRTNKSHLRTLNRVDSSSRIKRTSEKNRRKRKKNGQKRKHGRKVVKALKKERKTRAFAAPPSIDGLIDFVNQLGYPKLVMNLSDVVTNDLFQPWRALLTIINLCLTGKTSGFERPRAPVLHILWGIVTRTNIDYAERIWEEFTQSIHTFIKDKQNLSRHTSGKKRATMIVITSIQFTKLIIHHLQRKHRFHPRPDSPHQLSNEEPVLGYLKFSGKGTKSKVLPIPDSLITVEIQQATYYQEYLAKVTHHRKYLVGETGGVQNPPALKPTQPARKPKAPTRPSILILVASTQPAPTSAPAKSQENKHKQATETTDKPAKAKRIKHSISRKTRQPRSSPKSVGASEAEELPPVVIRKPESGKYQPLLEVPGKGKAKVTEEHVTHDLLSLQKHKKTNNEEESEKVVHGAEEGGQDEGHARPDPDAQAEDQTGSDTDLGDAEAKVQSISSPVVYARSDCEHMDLDVANVSPQPSTEQLDEGFTATVYPNVQQNLKLAVEEPVLLEEPASSSGTLSSLQHMSRDFSFGDQFFNDKHLDVDKNAETKVE